jgi:hypothetical protein
MGELLEAHDNTKAQRHEVITKRSGKFEILHLGDAFSVLSVGSVVANTKRIMGKIIMALNR